MTEPQVRAGERAGDPQDNDWQWRRRIRSNPHSHRIYKWVVAFVGLVIVVGGLALVPLPGPGWLIVLFGLVVWASEFVWAATVLNWAKARLQDWNDWLAPKAWWVKGLVGLATLALVLAVFWALFALTGVPGWFPDAARTQLVQLPGLGR